MTLLTQNTSNKLADENTLLQKHANLFLFPRYTIVNQNILGQKRHYIYEYGLDLSTETLPTFHAFYIV